MHLLLHIQVDEILSTYRRTKEILRGNDPVIFSAMAAATQGKRPAFVVPTNPADFKKKHDEIEAALRYSRITDAGLCITLVDEIWAQVQAAGGIPNLRSDSLLEQLAFRAAHGVIVRLVREGHWVAEWPIELHANGIEDKTLVALGVYRKDWGDIVPEYVVQYLSSAVHAYQRGMSAAAVALLSIALEATLRDVLETRNYTFDRSASPVDVYPETDATVSVDLSSGVYTLAFSSPLKKTPADFSQSVAGSSFEIHVRRVVNRHNGRVDLHVRAPSALLDHWSPDVPSQRAKKSITGLGAAIDVARNHESVLTPQDIPIDLDEVISVVRNNLIHLSGAAMDTPLRKIDPSGATALSDFLGDPLKVYDLVTNIAHFIDRQYVDLRRSGFLVK